MEESAVAAERDRQPPPHYLAVIIREKTFIIIGTVICLVVSALASIALPDIYEASATLLLIASQTPRLE